MNTVIVVQVGEEIVKVCESWEAYDYWIENHGQWDEDEVSTLEANVFTRYLL